MGYKRQILKERPAARMALPSGLKIRTWNSIRLLTLKQNDNDSMTLWVLSFPAIHHAKRKRQQLMSLPSLGS